MWYNGKSVIATHTKNGTQMAWAIVSGVGSGWLRITPAKSSRYSRPAADAG